jgi:transglutaminase-like putative cysteine protease
MPYRVTHTTVFSYSQPVSLGYNLVHLTPRAHPRQSYRNQQFLIQPSPAVLSEGVDYFGNPTTYFTLQEPHRELRLEARWEAQVLPSATFDPEATPPWEEVREAVRADHSPSGLEVYQFVFPSPYVPYLTELAAYATPSLAVGRPLLAGVLELTQRIHSDFRFDLLATSITTPLREVLDRRCGVCQDFAHLQIGCLRALGLAARYVSGYLLTRPPPGGPRLVGADASHAWLSVYCPPLGWIDVDPTNNVVPSDQHITLAWGRDYEDVSPIKGVLLGGGEQAISVGVDVIEVPENSLWWGWEFIAG